ncbi:MAG: dihydroorotase [Pseudomonadota bacterium]|jgi:dihydroorotase
MPERPRRWILRDARVIDPTQGLDEIATLIVEDDKIVGLTQESPDAPSGSTISAQGLVLMPGFIDLRAHLGEPGLEYREDVRSGLASAAAGGYVRVCCLPDTQPVNDCRAVTEALLNSAARAGGAELGPIGAVTRGLKGQELAEIGDLKEAGVVAVSDAGHAIERADLMRNALRYCRTFDVLLMQQAQVASLIAGAQMHEGATSARLGLRGWPRVAESIALQRDLLLAGDTGARYHASTLSTREGVALVREAKSRGFAVSCDITPYHLLETDRCLEGYDSRFKFSPPLREAADRDALLEAALDGTIDCIVTDHQPRSALETNAEFEIAEPGAVGLELCLSLLWQCVNDGRLPIARLAHLLSTGPARVLGIDAPSFRAGSEAYFTLIDPTGRFSPARSGLLSKSRNTPYWDRELPARVVMTVGRGKVLHSAVSFS